MWSSDLAGQMRQAARREPFGGSASQDIGFGGRAPRVALLVLVALGALCGIHASAAIADDCQARYPAQPPRMGPSAYLPDCRAYEMVTAPFTFGDLSLSQYAGVLNGSNLITESLGGYGGAEEDTGVLGSLYTIRREAAGWTTRPLGAPASQYYGPSGTGEIPLADVSNDFSHALIEYAPRSSSIVDTRFYTRQLDGPSPEVGPLREVGPAIPPATVESWKPSKGDAPIGLVHYAGGTDDLSHVTFELAPSAPGHTSFLWPGDGTIEDSSLYEYVGMGHTGRGADHPALVGVDNQGQQISQCGTVLGEMTESGSSGFKQHAVSTGANGTTTVYFTAKRAGCTPGGGTPGNGPPANELYARLNGTRTVDISEPSREDCSECDTSAPADARFRGAAPDGSKAFFLSQQKLLPGAEGKSLYEYDFNGASGKRVTLLAPKVLGVGQVSDDASHVYFTSEGVLAGNEDARGEPAKAGEPNLYVLDNATHVTTFIAALASGDSEDWTRGSVDATPDGRFLLLASTNDLTPDSAGTGSQLYRYDAQDGQLVRVSIGEQSPSGYYCPSTGRTEPGFNCNGNTGDKMDMPVSPGGEARAAPRSVSISDDGTYVFFNSIAGLTPRALNHVIVEEPCLFEEEGICFERNRIFAQNGYEWHNGQVYLISDGQDRHVVREQSATAVTGASPNGSDVFLATADQLVPQDTDTQRALYDARIGGGFPPPARPSACEGEACQGAISAAPPAQTPGSLAFSGPGNLAPPGPTAAPKAKAPTRAQKLAKALRACRKRPGRRRRACEAQARRKYGATHAPRRVRRHR
jgi:hypothetical protein